MYKLFMRLFFRVGEGESLDYITVESPALSPDQLTPEGLAALEAEALQNTAEHEGCDPSALTPVEESEVREFEMKLAMKQMGVMGGRLAALFGDDDEDPDDEEPEEDSEESN